MALVSAATFTRVASTEEIPPGIMRKVVLDGGDVLIANVGGNYYAIGNLCTHQEAPLDEGTFHGHEVTCPWHGSRFDLQTGSVTAGPAETPVPGYEIRIEGTDIFIRTR